MRRTAYQNPEITVAELDIDAPFRFVILGQGGIILDCMDDLLEAIGAADCLMLRQRYIEASQQLRRISC